MYRLVALGEERGYLVILLNVCWQIHVCGFLNDPGKGAQENA